ncbi:MAG: DUF4229 domain-containing protein [Microbacteriaceae bacterium]|nr:DUF4229 domain-containing protein [Microbacteriaceae bacterium]
MNTRTAWTMYIALRLLFFVVPFAVMLWVLHWPWWLAAIVATFVALSLSVIFLSKPREVASESIYDWRMRDRTADDVFEDDAIEAVESVEVSESDEAAEPVDLAATGDDIGEMRDR